MLKRYLCFVLAAAMLLCMAGCRKRVDAPTEEPTLTFEPTEAPTEAAAQPTTEPATEPATEPTTEPTEAELVLHSGLREDGSFSAGTLFIGDSLTYNFTGSYLPENGLLGDAKYTTQCGSQLTVFFGTTKLEYNSQMMTRYSEEFQGMEFDEAAASFGEKAEAIYIMWGTNYTPNATKDDYIAIVDFLLENCPNATIHMQTIPYGDVIAYKTVNERINGAFAHYQEKGEPRVFLIDTYTAIGNHTVDGVHLNVTGNTNWYQAIVAHAEANNLSE